jgi:hypothetical protein
MARSRAVCGFAATKQSPWLDVEIASQKAFAMTAPWAGGLGRYL